MGPFSVEEIKSVQPNHVDPEIWNGQLSPYLKYFTRERHDADGTQVQPPYLGPIVAITGRLFPEKSKAKESVEGFNWEEFPLFSYADDYEEVQEDLEDSVKYILLFGESRQNQLGFFLTLGEKSGDIDSESQSDSASEDASRSSESSGSDIMRSSSLLSTASLASDNADLDPPKATPLGGPFSLNSKPTRNCHICRKHSLEWIMSSEPISAFQDQTFNNDVAMPLNTPKNVVPRIRSKRSRSREVNRIQLTFSSTEKENFFGFGEQFSFFNFKGKRVPILVQEQGIGRGDQPITALANLVSHRFKSHIRILFQSIMSISQYFWLDSDGFSIYLMQFGLNTQLFFTITDHFAIEENR